MNRHSCCKIICLKGWAVSSRPGCNSSWKWLLDHWAIIQVPVHLQSTLLPLLAAGVRCGGLGRGCAEPPPPPTMVAPELELPAVTLPCGWPHFSLSEHTQKFVMIWKEKCTSVGHWNQEWVTQNDACQLLWHVHSCHSIGEISSRKKEFSKLLTENSSTAVSFKHVPLQSYWNSYFFPTRYCPAILTPGKMTEQES